MMAFCPSRREKPLTPSCMPEWSQGTGSLGHLLAFVIPTTMPNILPPQVRCPQRNSIWTTEKKE